MLKYGEYQILKRKFVCPHIAFLFHFRRPNFLLWIFTLQIFIRRFAPTIKILLFIILYCLGRASEYIRNIIETKNIEI